MLPFSNFSHPTCSYSDVPEPALHFSNIFSWLFYNLRLTFYLIKPSEESFEAEHLVPSYHTETYPLLISVALLEWILLRWKGKQVPTAGESISTASIAISKEMMRLLSRGFEHSLYVYIYRNYRIVDLPWDSPFTWYLAAILIDFTAYWGHRAAHEYNFLWAFHQLHHSAESYTLINAFRLPLIQDVLVSLGNALFAFLIPPSHFLVHMQLNVLFQFWLHTSFVPPKLPNPLGKIINTPYNHRIHHACNKEYLDKNYSAVLILWDRMFGTYQEEVPGKQMVFGLVEQVESFESLHLQTFYLRKMVSKFQAMTNWKDKLFSVIKGPGWTPGSPWTGFINQVPDVTGRSVYRGVHVSTYLSTYLSINFLLAVFTFEALCLFEHRLGSMAVLCHMTYLFFSMTVMGLFFDGHPLGPPLELLRSIFLFLYGMKGLPLLKNALCWSGLVGLFGVRLVDHVTWALNLYFLSSVVVSALVTLNMQATHNERRDQQKKVM